MVAAVPSIIERLPPHNVEAEQSVLGSLLIDRDAIIRVAAFLRPEDFYAGANGSIYRAILDLYNRREPTDFVTLSDELQRRGQYDQAGGLSYLSSLLNAVPTAVHVEYYARIVERAATLRRLIDAGTEIVDIGFREGIDTEDALDAAERAVFAVSQRRQTKDFVSMGDVLDRFFDQIDYLQQHRGEVVGVATGFSDLDQLTGGLQRSDLIIVAARPSMGKTSLALGMAYGAAVGHGKTVGIFSLEMSAEQLVQRVLSMETGVDTHRLRLGQIDDNEWDRISRAFGRLSEAPIYIDDASASNIMDVRSKARRLQAEHGLDLIIVDYLQLMTARRTENRVQEISEISRGLKGLARELNVPVVALSQLSRAVESRSDHRPMLSDLRESGSIEQDADIVIFIYREESTRRTRKRRASPRSSSPSTATVRSARSTCASSTARRDSPIWSSIPDRGCNVMAWMSGLRPSRSWVSRLVIPSASEESRRSVLTPLLDEIPRAQDDTGAKRALGAEAIVTRRFNGFLVQTDPAVGIPRAFFTDVLPQISELSEVQATLAVFRLASEAGGIESPVSEIALRADRAAAHRVARQWQPARAGRADRHRARPGHRTGHATPLRRRAR